MELGIRCYNVYSVTLGELFKLFEPCFSHYKLGIPPYRVVVRVKYINQDKELGSL